MNNVGSASRVGKNLSRFRSLLRKNPKKGKLEYQKLRCKKRIRNEGFNLKHQRLLHDLTMMGKKIYIRKFDNVRMCNEEQYD